MSKKKLVLVIRDGYGRRDEQENNAVAVADTPFTDYLMNTYPTCLLETSGTAVGLPEGFMGGSEVGHLTIGAGRVVWQSLELINRSIDEGSFFEKKGFLKLLSYAKKHNKAIHLIGLLQDKGVHSHQDHLFAMMKLCAQQDIPKEKVRIHIFSDGRDSPPRSLQSYIELLKQKISEYNIGVISSLVGRYYAMDRDTRWQRTKHAYDLLIHGVGKEHNTIDEAIQDAYASGENDEFITSRVIGDFTGIYPDDVIFCYNYRTDRVRQLCKALLEKDFSEFETVDTNLHMATLTKYYDEIQAEIIFRQNIPKNMLGEVISTNGCKQLRISETEKYPHITFFFNGQRSKPFQEEHRVLIASPREVATYDEKPEMSIYEIKDALLKEMDKQYDLIVVNYVNGDMVGHTGDMSAAVKAVEAVDIALKETIESGLTKGYDFLVFADHGNCEEMAGEHQTSHTLNKVDCILVSNNPKYSKEHTSLSDGGLKDIAVTALDILELPVPEEMTGSSLIK